MNLKEWKSNMIHCITNEPEVKRSPENNKLLLFKKGGNLHNIEFPALIEFYPNGKVKRLVYFTMGAHLRDPYEEKDQPVELLFYESGAKRGIIYNLEEDDYEFNKPTHYEFYESGSIKRLYYLYNNLHFHHDRGPIQYPCKIHYYENGDIYKEEYGSDDFLHREPINEIDQPAIIKYYPGNKIKKVKYFYIDELVRNQPGEPVIIKYNIEGEIIYKDYAE